MSFAKRIPSCLLSIPTGSIEKERGEIDWIAVLAFVVVLQFWQFSLLRKTAEAWRSAYQNLEESLETGADERREEFRAFGKDWKSPLPRIDYGAYDQRDRDAEAVCIIGRESLSSEDFRDLRCE